MTRSAAGWDHPRVCGEQVDEINEAVLRAGSPPRVRGTGQSHSFTDRQNRITPACAGNRLCQHPRPHPWQDHPRVCGEQYLRHRLALNVGGSPPRVRGTDADPVSVADSMGITPACAGNRDQPQPL